MKKLNTSNEISFLFIHRTASGSYVSLWSNN